MSPESRKPLAVPRTTGTADSTNVAGRFMVGDSKNVDPKVVELFSEAAKCLSACCAAMRTAGKLKDAERDEALQLILPTAVLVVGEAFALLGLVTSDLAVAARIHLRSIGELSRLIRLYHDNPTVAVRILNSLPARSLKAAEGMKLEGELFEAIKAIADDAPEKATDRKILAEERESLNKLGGLYATNDELEALSIASHGAIPAIATTADQIAGAGPDIVSATQLDGKGDWYLVRGTLWLLAIVGLCIGYGVGVQAKFDELSARSEELATAHGFADPKASG